MQARAARKATIIRGRRALGSGAAACEGATRTAAGTTHRATPASSACCALLRATPVEARWRRGPELPGNGRGRTLTGGRPLMQTRGHPPSRRARGRFSGASRFGATREIVPCRGAASSSDCAWTPTSSGARWSRACDARPPSIPPKYFYDRLGCALYGAICELPEYYPTRTERAIFSTHREAIAAAVGTGGQFVDLGAGDCCKAESWLPFLMPARYLAVDLAEDALARSLDRLARGVPGGRDAPASWSISPTGSTSKRTSTRGR